MVLIGGFDFSRQSEDSTVKTPFVIHGESHASTDSLGAPRALVPQVSNAAAVIVPAPPMYRRHVNGRYIAGHLPGQDSASR